MRLVVAGSGIVGSACAYVAAGLGAQVTLIDAARPGQATAAGAGIICPWTAGLDDPAGYAFACAAARAYPALVAELAGLGEADVSYRQVGALVVADDDDQHIDWLRTAPFIGLHLACVAVIWVGVSGFAVAFGCVATWCRQRKIEANDP